MKMTVLKKMPVVALLVTLFATESAFSGGFKIPDQSTRAMGMIDAFVAGADDASSVYYNPAGLTHLTGPEVIGNIYFAHGITYYDGVEGSETSDGRYYTVPSFYFATPVKGLDNWFFGVGVYSPYGLGSMWGDGNDLRYDSTLSEIELININPSIAWKVNDKLSLGAGINYFESRVKMRNKVMNPPGEPDGEQDIDADGDGWGYNIGLQYQATDTVRLGLGYRSQVTVSYDGDMQLDQVAVPAMGFPWYKLTYLRSGLDADIEYPQVVAGGIMWQATQKLRLELAAEWQQWSTRETQDFTLKGSPPYISAGTTSMPTRWEDSWLIMLGGEYAVNDKWTVRAGYGFNETPVPGETAEPSLPTGDTHALALGTGYKWTDKLTVDVATIVAYAEERTISDPDGGANGSDYSGEYDALSFYVSVGFRYQF
ncbi:MAG: OmpP1/FadL family transporter [Candidatus Pacebacteria bacterium]|nr:OmpP1/FadL family transporter [Candidatus Paceibacterota bacterium]